MLLVLQAERFVPLYLRKKVRVEKQQLPPVFELLPPAGALQPGERQNVQVKFTPTEEVSPNS